jgi:hypothetical protein
MVSIVVSELLCYLQNNFKNYARDLVGVAIVGFFSEEEISAAKQCLYNEMELLKLEGMSRKKTRNPSDLRKELECEDLLNLFAFADASKCHMPTFVAANLQRLPSVTPGEVAICIMAASVAALTAKLDALTNRMESMDCSNLVNLTKRLDSFEAQLTQGTTLTAAAEVKNAAISETNLDVASAGMSWSSIVKKPVAVRVKGSAAQSAVKAVPRTPRPKVVQAFVGRLHSDTTADELSRFLKDAGLEVISCRKLKPPNGKTFSTVAFFVECADTEDGVRFFYDESTWPAGAELRDWYTKS